MLYCSHINRNSGLFRKSSPFLIFRYILRSWGEKKQLLSGGQDAGRKADELHASSEVTEGELIGLTGGIAVYVFYQS